jgi:dTDP-glucose 4,6-dehydratase
MRYDIDPSYIQEKLGWKQSVSFEEGVTKTVEWYKNNEAWWKPYKERITLMRDSGLYNIKNKGEV